MGVGDFELYCRAIEMVETWLECPGSETIAEAIDIFCDM
jgi:hypothetical protein